MDFDYEIDEPHLKARTKYNFDRVQPGASLHVKTDEERCRVLAAFKYWTHKLPSRKGAYATSSKVGDEDPRGPGFRIWFKSSRMDAERTAAKMDMPVQPVPPAAHPDQSDQSDNEDI